MIKTAYELGIKIAYYDAGLLKDVKLSSNDLEKIAKFLWYRDVAEALPTFRKLLGLAPEMGHRVAKGSLEAIKKAPRKYVSRPAMPGMAKFKPGTFART